MELRQVVRYHSLSQSLVRKHIRNRGAGGAGDAPPAADSSNCIHFFECVSFAVACLRTMDQSLEAHTHTLRVIHTVVCGSLRASRKEGKTVPPPKGPLYFRWPIKVRIHLARKSPNATDPAVASP